MSKGLDNILLDLMLGLVMALILTGHLTKLGALGWSAAFLVLMLTAYRGQRMAGNSRERS